MITTIHILLLLILVNGILLNGILQPDFEFPEWVVDDSGCRTLKDGYGECIDMNNCTLLTDFLALAPKPLPKELRNLVWAYQCGLTKEKTAKVCCPSGTTIFGYENGILTSTVSFSTTTVVSRLKTVTERSRSRSDSETDLTKQPNYELNDKTCGTLSFDDRIIHGEEANILEFPWMALIFYKTQTGLKHLCGGTLISSRYVLTAAHCIADSDRVKAVSVRLGEHDTSKEKDCDLDFCAPPVQDIQIEEVLPHPLYNKSILINDIGLIRLASAANTSAESVRSICLPIDQSTRSIKLEQGVVTGWGQTTNASASNVLLKITVPIVDQPTCHRRYFDYSKKTIYPEFHFCAGGIKDKDSCKGDSGGPIQFIVPINGEDRYVQYGVVSFGTSPCALNNIPGVYTNVSNYIEWIFDNMKP